MNWEAVTFKLWRTFFVYGGYSRCVSDVQEEIESSFMGEGQEKHTQSEKLCTHDNIFYTKQKLPKEPNRFTVFICKLV